MRTALLVAACTLSIAGCASTMTVGSYVDRTVPRQAFRTFEWGPADALPTGDPRLDRDPFFKDQVQGAVEKQLAAHGIVLAEAARPDLLIHYHANISRRIDINLGDRSYEYCAEGACPQSTSFEAGTLVVDVIDARTNRLLWRGWAQRSVEDALSDHDRMARLISEAVTRMLREFPAAP